MPEVSITKYLQTNTETVNDIPWHAYRHVGIKIDTTLKIVANRSSTHSSLPRLLSEKPSG